MASLTVAVPECLFMLPDAIKTESEVVQSSSTVKCSACGGKLKMDVKEEEEDEKNFLSNRTPQANYDRGELDTIDGGAVAIIAFIAHADATLIDVELYGFRALTSPGTNQRSESKPGMSSQVFPSPGSDDYPLLWEPHPPRYRKFNTGLLKRRPEPLFNTAVEPRVILTRSEEAADSAKHRESEDPYDDSDIYGMPHDHILDNDTVTGGSNDPVAAARAFSIISLEDDSEPGPQKHYTSHSLYHNETNYDSGIPRTLHVDDEVQVEGHVRRGEPFDPVKGSASARSLSPTPPIYGQFRRDIYEDSSDAESEPSSPVRPATLLPPHSTPPATRSIVPVKVNPQKRPVPSTISSEAESDSDPEFESEVLTQPLRKSASGSEDERDGLATRVRPLKRRIYVSPEPSSSDRPAEEQTAPIPHKRRRTVIPKPALQSPPGLDLEAGSKNLPLAAHNRARRVVLLQDVSLPLATISMRADVNFFHSEKRHRIASYSLPCRTSQRVADVCNVADTIVIGFSRGPNQVSLVSFNRENKPYMTGLNHHAHKDASLTCLASQGFKDRGVTFYTGGTDKKVYFWTRLNTGTRDRAKSELLFRSLTVPAALCSIDRTLLCGTGTKLLSIDVDHPVAKPSSAEFSNVVHHIHVHPANRAVTILEVRHHEEQILIFDSRKYNKSAASKFGYKSSSGRTSSFYRGSTWGSYFARGYSDGNVCLWDYRNPKIPVMRSRLRQAGPVIHALVTDRWVACYSNESLTFADFDGNLLDSTSLSSMQL